MHPTSRVAKRLLNLGQSLKLPSVGLRGEARTGMGASPSSPSDSSASRSSYGAFQPQETVLQALLPLMNLSSSLTVTSQTQTTSFAVWTLKAASNSGRSNTRPPANSTTAALRVRHRSSTESEPTFREPSVICTASTSVPERSSGRRTTSQTLEPRFRSGGSAAHRSWSMAN